MATVPLRDVHQVLAGPRWIGMPRMSSPERPGKTATSHNASAWLPVGRYLCAGASGFLLKDTQPAELLQALPVVMGGDSLLSPAVTRRLISEFIARPPDAVAAVGMETLTNREREVVALVAHGLSNDEIADAMVLSPATAKTHVSRAMIKLGARDRAQLVVFAYQTGLVTPRAPIPAPLRARIASVLP